MAKKGMKQGNVSPDTWVNYPNASREVDIFGDLEPFDVKNWNADAYLVGATNDGNTPFNTYSVNNLEGLAANYQSGNDDGLQMVPKK
jgi:hypothetical protein